MVVVFVGGFAFVAGMIVGWRVARATNAKVYTTVKKSFMNEVQSTGFEDRVWSRTG